MQANNDNKNAYMPPINKKQSKFGPEAFTSLSTFIFFVVLLFTNTTLCDENVQLLRLTNSVLVIAGLSSAFAALLPDYSGDIRFLDWAVTTPLLLFIFWFIGDNDEEKRPINFLVTAGFLLGISGALYRYLPTLCPNMERAVSRYLLGFISIALLAYILYEAGNLTKRLQGTFGFLYLILLLWLGRAIFYIYSDEDPEPGLAEFVAKIGFTLACTTVQ